MSALAAALRGDEFFFQAIEDADPDSYGIYCPCGTYAVGDFKDFQPQNSICPDCGHNGGGMESPALGSGPKLLTIITEFKL